MANLRVPRSVALVTGALMVAMAASACSADQTPTVTPSAIASVTSPSVSGATFEATPEATPQVGPFWGLVPIEPRPDARIHLTAVAVADDGRAVAIGTLANGAAAVATSTGGPDWTLETDEPQFDDAIPTSVVTYRDGFVIAGGIDGARAVVWVGDGLGEWTRVELPGPTSFGLITGLAVTGGRVVAVGEGAWYSDDSSNWTRAEVQPGTTLGAPPFAPDVGCLNSFEALSVVGDRLTATVRGSACGGDHDELWTSGDGARWDVAATSLPGELSAMVELDDEIIAFGTASNRVGAWTLDAGTFEPEPAFDAMGATSLTDVTYTDNGLLATMDGSVWASSDGRAWRPVMRPRNGEDAYAVAWTPSRSIAVGARSDGRPAVWTNPTLARASMSVHAQQPPQPGQVIGGAWEVRASTPADTIMAAAQAPDGTVLAFGRITNGDQPATTVVQAYNRITDTWTVQPITVPIDGWLTSAAAHRDAVLVAVDVNLGTQLTAYDRASRRLVPIGPVLTASNGQLIDIGGRLYLWAAGLDPGASVLWALDDASLTWNPLSAPPGPIEAAAAASNGSTLYALIRGRLWAYDISDDGWTPLSKPSPRRGDVAPVVDGNGVVWLLGGFTEGSPDRLVLAFDPRDGAWRIGPELVRPRYRPIAVTLDDGSVLLIGGSSNSGFVNAVELFGPGRP